MNVDWKRLAKIAEGKIFYMSGTKMLLAKALVELKQEHEKLKLLNLELHGLTGLIKIQEKKK